MKKYIYIYILAVFQVVGMRKKMMLKKKKVAGAGMGYCQFPRLGHDTTDCIVTQQDTRCSQRATKRPGHAHDMAIARPRHGHSSATTWPGWATTRLVARRGVRRPGF